MTATAVVAHRGTSTGIGISLLLGSSAAFGLSGPLAKSLLDTGWTPGAVVLARVGGAALVLLAPTVLLLGRTGLPTARQTRRLLVYGVVAVALAQLCYFNAVQRLSVGVALLLEYLAPVLLIFWHWQRSRIRPATSVLLGGAVAMTGMVLVLGLLNGLRLDAVGVLWGLGAALCLGAYFLLSENTDPADSVPPLLMTAVGTGIGALIIVGAGTIGVLRLTMHASDTRLAGRDLSWWVPVAALVSVSAVLAYLTGIAGVRRLGSSVASFIALTEVIFAVIFAMILLGQQPTAGQLVGGALVLVGITVVQRRSAPPARSGR